MSAYRARKGLDLPIAGAPEQVVHDAPPVQRVALLAADYVGLKPRLRVVEGDRVRLGDPLFEDRRIEGLRFPSPAAGTVVAVNRGEKRALQSVVVEIEGDGREAVAFGASGAGATTTRDGARELLLASGLWSALRMRPFGRVPRPDAVPAAIFVTAMDTHPLAPDLDVVMRGREDDVERGLRLLGLLTDGPVWFCRREGSTLGVGSSGARVAEFSGPHPAGTVGFHIHSLRPVTRGIEVWHLGVQDVARIGRLVSAGTLDPDVVVALGGPGVVRPRLVRTRLGADLGELLRGELAPGRQRVVSGSVLHGRRADDEAHAFLGRYAQQVSVLPEGGHREFLGWMVPGSDRFSVLPMFTAAFAGARRFTFDTGTHGSRRAMVPIGVYERVMPMDLMPTHLLRAIAVGDVEWAEELGVLELDEEDVALCTYVCPGKYEYGPALRRLLTQLEVEG